MFLHDKISQWILLLLFPIVFILAIGQIRHKNRLVFTIRGLIKQTVLLYALFLIVQLNVEYFVKILPESFQYPQQFICILQIISGVYIAILFERALLEEC
jgi:hypothetical protein